MARPRIGVDIGGTHTDCVLFDPESNEIEIAKTPSTPTEPSNGVIEGVSALFESAAYDPRDVEFFSHGTTITTNALLERDGARTGMLVTEGFRAIQETRDQARGYGAATYDLSFEKPEALVPQSRTYEIPERVAATGDVEQPLNETAVREAAKELRESGVETVAVCYLFSFANAEHEQRTKEIFQKEYPDCSVSLSSEILPQLREWHRMSTTQMNAYLEPILTQYIGRLEQALRDADFNPGGEFVMQSNGGVMPFEAAKSDGNAAQTLLSGPAAGVQAGTHLTTVAGYEDVITLDMGGTSADMALVEDGEPLETTEGSIGGLDMHLPMLSIDTISTGGGTLAWLDEADNLRVGPESAGADPGPACYPEGGNKPTVTDADLLLGYLNPDYFLGGDMGLAVDDAQTAVKRVGEPLGLDALETALGVRRLIDTKMSESIRGAAARRGQDLREFTLVAFGGAGPVHASTVADSVNIPRVLVPPSPGVGSALGLLTVDVAHDYSLSELSQIDSTDPERATELFTELVEEAMNDIQGEGFEPANATITREFDMRYAGQGHEIRIAVPTGDLSSNDLDTVRDTFDERHQELRGHAAPEDAVEIVNYRVRARVTVPKYEPDASSTATSGESPVVDTREVVFERGQAAETAVYRRRDLAYGHEIQGPAIVEQLDSTIVVPPDWTGRIDEYDNFVMEVDR
jgi:N-methylhydantoinase A